MIGFLIFTAEDVRDSEIKSQLEPHQLQVQSDNSPANEPLTLEEEGKRDPGGANYEGHPVLATAIQGPHLVVGHWTIIKADVHTDEVPTHIKCIYTYSVCIYICPPEKGIRHLSAAVCVLGTELRTFGKSVSALNH